MEIRNIITFLRVAELQSFTNTAKKLGYSQSAITIQIKQLEEELGVQLFERIGRNVKLTEQGKSFSKYAKSILETIQEAKTAIKESEDVEGELKIGAVESLSTSVLPTILMEHQKICPRIKTTIVTGLNSDMFQMIRKNELDIIYFLDKQVYFPEWIKVVERMEPIFFTAPCTHPLTRKSDVALHDILKEDLVLTEKGYSYRFELEQVLAKKGYELAPILEIGNTDVIIKTLINHTGISFLPYYTIKEYIDNNELAIIHIPGIDIQMWSQLVYHKNKWITPQMQIFIDLMKKYASG